MKKPKTLYKYRKFNHESLACIINKEIYFANPTEFNDPFDGQIDLNHALRDAVGKLANKQAIFGYDVIRPGDVIRDYAKQQSVIRNLGIYSLSEENKNVLMWSHYADSHQGFCVGYSYEYVRTSKINDVHALLKVDYICGNPFGSLMEDVFDKILITDKDLKALHNKLLLASFKSKAKSWKYEKEYRLISKTKGLKPFRPTMVTEIIFGLNMRPKDKITLRNMLSGKEWSHVTFNQADRNKSNIQLVIRKANDSDYL